MFCVIKTLYKQVFMWYMYVWKLIFKYEFEIMCDLYVNR